MSSALKSEPAPAPAVPNAPKVRLFTASEVWRMVDSGVLRADEHLELIEGKLLEMTPQGPPHAELVTFLLRRLMNLYADGFDVRPALPLDVGESSIPEPDLAVVRSRGRELSRRHPRGVDAALVVEVARTSQALDRAKAAIYARAEVPVYWLVDVVAENVEVYEGPQPNGTYRSVRQLSDADPLTPPGTTAAWPVRELFP